MQPPYVIRGFAHALFIMSSGYSPLALHTLEDGTYEYTFPAAAAETRVRYFASRDLLTKMQNKLLGQR